MKKTYLLRTCSFTCYLLYVATSLIDRDRVSIEYADVTKNTRFKSLKEKDTKIK